MTKNASSLSWAIAAIVTLTQASAFIVIVPTNMRGNHHAAATPVRSNIQIQPLSPSISTSLFAEKKKRRRRTPTSSTSNPSPQIDDEEEDVLPDFDLIADIDLKEQAASAAKLAGGNLDLDDPDIVAAMRASKGVGVMGGSGSTKDLLRSRNRELEDKLVVNRIVEDLPSLAQYTQEKSQNVSGGSKAAKRMARRAAALEKENVAEEEESFISTLLSKVPFFKKEENPEKKTAVKVRNLMVS
jgi:uncharacterized protein YoxC